MYKYPYGNSEQMNLDWFFAQWEKFKAAWAEAEQGIDGALDAEIAKVEAAMTDLYAARDAAAASQTAAAASALAAAASQTAAANSATAAQSAETAAAGSESRAAASAEDAAGSATSADNAARAAASSEDTATQQASAAGISAQAAANSATAAADSATTAAGSASDASDYADAAAGSANDAADSADDAADSAAAAAASAAASDGAAAQAMIATAETTTTAAAAHAAGSYFRLNGTLYKATADIAISDTITPGTNCTAVTVGAELTSQSEAISEKTKNIWAGNNTYSGTGYNNSGVYYVALSTVYASGTYTISGVITSNDTFATKSLIGIFDSTGTSYTASSRIYQESVDRGTRFKITFTATKSFSRFMFCASNSATNSSGDTLTITDIQLETGSTATPYYPPITAKDFVARQSVPLESTGDTTDRTEDILYRLEYYGCCVLGKGDFYTKGITMPDNTTIKGQGDATKLYLASEQENETITMGSRCNVEEMCIFGDTGSVTLDGTITSRSGIGWNRNTNVSGTVHNCRISRFTGAGIVMQDTGTDTHRGLLISDCYISGCNAGIYIRKNSEFHKITNCTIIGNYYGYLNRGGNNALSNSGIDSNVINAQIDADEGSNNGHGTITGCSFNHANSNTGYSLIIKDTGRMLVSNCNFYYGKTLLQNTSGNIINGCGFGQSSGWEINGGDCNIFANCMVRGTGVDDTPITITNNASAVITNCYTRQGTAVVRPT